MGIRIESFQYFEYRYTSKKQRKQLIGIKHTNFYPTPIYYLQRGLQFVNFNQK